MEYLIKTTLIGLFFGTFGTTIGGIIGVIFKNTSNKFLGFILSLVILGLLFGVVCMIICDIAVQKKFQTSVHYSKNTNSLLKTGIIVSIGLALHNFPEGLAIGSGFGASIKLGYSLAIAILLHDIPERSIYGSSNEKWGNEKIKGYILRCIIRCYNRNRSIIWSINTEAFHKK